MSPVGRRPRSATPPRPRVETASERQRSRTEQVRGARRFFLAVFGLAATIVAFVIAYEPRPDPHYANAVERLERLDSLYSEEARDYLDGRYASIVAELERVDPDSREAGAARALAEDVRGRIEAARAEIERRRRELERQREARRETARRHREAREAARQVMEELGSKELTGSEPE